MPTLADVSRELAAVVGRLTPEEQDRARRILRQQQRGFRTNEYISRTWPHLRPGHARDNPKQRWFLGLTQREVMFGGAGGGGKTEALLISALQYADIPRYSALIIGETYKDLNDADAVMSRAKQLLAGFPTAHWHASSETFTFDTKWGPDEIAWKRRDLIQNDRIKPADATDDLCREALGPPPHAMLSFGYCCHDDHPFKFKCFHPDTDILTANGWKPVADVAIGELVASMDPATRRMTFRPVTETHADHFDGELESLYSRFGPSYCVTPNHRVLATTEHKQKLGNRALRFYRADELPATACIPQHCEWDGGEPPEPRSFSSDGHNGKTISFDGRAWVEFLGWFVTEGHINGRNITISQQKTEGRREIIRVLESTGYTFHFMPQHSRFDLCNKALRKWLLANCGTNSGDKKLPDEFRRWDRQSLSLLLSVLLQGDGGWVTKDHAQFTTSSETLRDQVSEIAVRLGMRATYSFQPNSASRYGGAWHLSIYRTTRDTEVSEARRERVPYKGIVYCITVPPHGTVLIRHRGRMCWSGNSKAYQFVGWEELTRQPTEKRYTYLFTRMRRLHGSSVPIRMRSATNPGDKGFEWVKQRFIPDEYLNAPEEERFTRIWQKRTKCGDCNGSGHVGSVQCLYCEGMGYHQRLFVPARSIDNPSLDSITYRQILAQVTWLERQYMEHGDWSVAPSGNLFKPEWIRTFTWAGDHFRLINPDAATALPGTTSIAPFELVDAKNVTYFITADTATREKTTADFTVICSWAYDRRKQRLMLVNCVRAQVDIPDISKLILREWARLKSLYGGRLQFVMIEDASSGPAVIREVHKHVTVKAFSPMCLGADRSDKVSRSATAQIMMENGEIFFPADDPHWLGPFLSELFAFNQGYHDDCVDNVAMAALWVSWQKSGTGNKPPPSSHRPGAARPIGSTHPLHHQ